jgi:hypothetical protein
MSPWTVSYTNRHLFRYSEENVLRSSEKNIQIFNVKKQRMQFLPLRFKWLVLVSVPQMFKIVSSALAIRNNLQTNNNSNT